MKLLDNLKNQIKEINTANKNYQAKIDSADILSNLYAITESEDKLISPYILKNKNSNINEKKAKVINNLIPYDEVYIEVLYAIESKTNKEYFIIATTKYLWIISLKGYLKFEYKSLSVELLKKSLLTKTISLLNYIFDIWAGDEEVNNFISIINNEEYRNKLITDTVEKYGDNEIYRMINALNAGISYDKDYNIRFYSNSINKRYNIKELENYELLLDNNVIQEKRLKEHSNKLTAPKNSCYEMKIRVTPKDHNIFEIPILEVGVRQEMYQNTSDVYIKCMEFAKEIMNQLDHISDTLQYIKKED